MELFTASRQWATRPADERFWTVEEMLNSCHHYYTTSRTESVSTHNLQIQTVGDDLRLVDEMGNQARFTNWSFNQLCQKLSVPAYYLRSLPAELAATNLNHGISCVRGEEKSSLLFHQNGDLLFRCITSEEYKRIWNWEICQRLVGLSEFGWKNPPASPSVNDDPRARVATFDDIVAGSRVQVGQMIAPAGLYASDHDMFVFMINENRVNDGTDEGLGRGFFLTNSEVRGGALKVTSFMFRYICQNHIVWNASNLNELKIVHKGRADQRFQNELLVELRKFADAAASEDEAKIVTAQRFKIGNNKEEVLDALFKKFRVEVTQKVLEASYDQAVIDSDSDKTIDPNTVWGMVQGMTRFSQSIPYMDERNKLDRVAGKVMMMAF